MASEPEPASVSVSFRRSGDVAVAVQTWDTVEAGALAAASPWRTFRWYKGQKHYSGSFWSATENDLVIYESRLELARLLFADFDVSVQHIVAQPFLLRGDVDGVLRRHIPDYLLFTGAGPVVVDVKPRHRVDRPENTFTFAWTKRAVESRGWRYEVWNEPSAVELENVRFWRDIAVPGCLTGVCLSSCARRIWMVPRWGRRFGSCRSGRTRWCARRCCICCGSSISRSI